MIFFIPSLFFYLDFSLVTRDDLLFVFFPFRSLLVVRDLTDDAPVCRDSLSPLDTPPRVVHDRH